MSGYPFCNDKSFGKTIIRPWLTRIFFRTRYLQYGKGKEMKKFAATAVALLAIPLVLSGCKGFGKQSVTVPASEIVEEPSESDSPIESTVPDELPPGLSHEAIYFDVTGDGNDDKVYCNMTGSGMVRVQCIVVDETNDVMYVLDGYDYSYGIEGVENGKLIVTEEGPYGYGDPLTTTYGTIRIKNGRLIFVADLDTLQKGLIVREKHWSDQGKGAEECTTVTVLHGGEIVYEDESYGVIKIDSANDKKVTLEIEGCFVEPNPDGSIDLRAEPLKEITIERDQTVTLKTQTMDGGVTLEIKYE